MSGHDRCPLWAVTWKGFDIPPIPCMFRVPYHPVAGDKFLDSLDPRHRCAQETTPKVWVNEIDAASEGLQGLIEAVHQLTQARTSAGLDVPEPPCSERIRGILLQAEPPSIE